MKVFISWSGPLSKKLGETLRDWLPGVLQLVKPYFTPSDIEKGTRWANEIGKELEESQVGILCITRENIHSDWVMFEAGALSKSLDKSHVCPVLFGIANTDLTGPLKQFQTTEFNKTEVHKLLVVINSRLGENKLPQKTLDNVFEKWWPDLEAKIEKTLNETEQSEEPVRTEREMLEEILLLSRLSSKRINRPTNFSPRAIQDLLNIYFELHDEQSAKIGSYQDTLDSLRSLHKPLNHIITRYKGQSDELDELIEKFNNLSYQVVEEDNEEEIEPPF